MDIYTTSHRLLQDTGVPRNCEECSPNERFPVRDKGDEKSVMVSLSDDTKGAKFFTGTENLQHQFCRM
ncbi:hypothetical protein HNY73_009243 [Argiope bruennichi]|uniref:Uncharacterized protein n=1 Tax=Argiope bruennichi TaxID=94029 RepID=A0A8T0F8X3_ARGBR|nr:hypothetical protein HNY73_009243 [Argiope bruennichi]